MMFNPWRFPNEDVLLKNFFNALAVAVLNSVAQSEGTKSKKPLLASEKEPLDSNKVVIGKFLKKFKGVAAYIGLDDAVESIGDALSEVDIEELKDSIQNLLVEHKKKIVVFVDDIDRLDSEEIHAILRLVKLTGELSYTTYVLAFDDEMVAAAIGKRFGAGNAYSGINFLEKIIQVPLRLPNAPKSALNSFCNNQLQEAIDSSGIVLSEKEVSRFVQGFNRGIQVRLNTPRLAIRYVNAITFSLPLVYGEVNTADLLLIEAIRVFFPRHYDWIKNQPELFVQSYKFGNEIAQGKVDRFKKEFDETNKDLTSNEQDAIRSLLSDMFPYVAKVYNTWEFQMDKEKDWYNDKRICSQSYFDRYFSYSVLQGDLSDVVFDKMLEDVKTTELQKSKEVIESILKTTDLRSFIMKLQNKASKLEWDSAVRLIEPISRLGSYFPLEDGIIGRYNSPMPQIAEFILRALLRQENEEQRKSFLIELMKVAEPLQFAFIIYKQNFAQEPNSRVLSNDNEYKDVFRALIARSVEEANEEAVFEKYDFGWELLRIWGLQVDPESCKEYITNTITNAPSKAMAFLTTQSPTFVSSVKPDTPFKGDFSQGHYNMIKSISNIDTIYKNVIATFGEELISNEILLTEDRQAVEQTEENILKQFVYWYRKDKGLIEIAEEV